MAWVVSEESILRVLELNEGLELRSGGGGIGGASFELWRPGEKDCPIFKFFVKVDYRYPTEMEKGEYRKVKTIKDLIVDISNSTGMIIPGKSKNDSINLIREALVATYSSRGKSSGTDKVNVIFQQVDKDGDLA